MGLTSIINLPFQNYCRVVYHTPFILKILDSTNNMIGGNKNNARAADNSFNDPMNTIYPENNFIDLSVMDGKNCCTDRKIILYTRYPIFVVVFGYRHTSHNIFNNFANLPFIAKIIKEDRYINNIFRGKFCHTPCISTKSCGSF